jgi:Protein of unknown function (DUF4235)
MRFVFAPIGIVAGLLAGLIAQKGFERLWAVFDDEEPPGPDEHDASYPKLIAALLVEGAVFRLTKGVVDHGTRGAFARLTGTWPGEKSSGENAA